MEKSTYRLDGHGRSLGTARHRSRPSAQAGRRHYPSPPAATYHPYDCSGSGPCRRRRSTPCHRRRHSHPYRPFRPCRLHPRLGLRPRCCPRLPPPRHRRPRSRCCLRSQLTRGTESLYGVYYRRPSAAGFVRVLSRVAIRQSSSRGHAQGLVRLPRSSRLPARARCGNVFWDRSWRQ